MRVVEVGAVLIPGGVAEVRQQVRQRGGRGRGRGRGRTTTVGTCAARRRARDPSAVEGPGRRQRAIDARDADGATTKAHIAERTCRDAPTRVPRGEQATAQQAHGVLVVRKDDVSVVIFGTLRSRRTSLYERDDDDGLDFISRIRDNHDEWAPSGPPPLVPSTTPLSHSSTVRSSLTTYSSPYRSLVSPRPLVERPTRRRRRPPPPRAASEARVWVAPVPAMSSSVAPTLRRYTSSMS